MSKQVAAEIKSMADRLGWIVSIRNEVLSISKQINGMDEFVKADGEYYSILGLLPQTSAGSSWGTDGGGVGAISALNKGVFVMNKSGGSKRVLSALAKLI